ncbi:MAG TPA: DUF2784 family protein [Bryobacteraceae bacterium]|nr:DUF2784 family protein [Bryobacteraceae bacterium]
METLANLVAVVHLAYFVFVVGGFAVILIGAAQRRPWIYNPWFRAIHLLSVLVVLAEDVFGFPCPLNTLEGALRSTPTHAGSPSGTGYVLDLLLLHTIPGRALDAIYWTLGVALLLLIFIIPPRFGRAAKSA